MSGCTQEAVVALQPRGSAVPLFLVAPGVEALSLVRHLGPNRPLFGIRVPNLDNVPGPHRIEDLAAVCVRAVRKARPQGPYALAGWCAAGVLGLEIARQLEAEGAQVAFVAMLDARTVFLPPMSGGKRLVVRGCHFLQRVSFFLSGVLAEGPKRIRSAVMSRLTQARDARQRTWRGLLPSHSDAIYTAIRCYRPAPWPGRMIHIWAAERPKGPFRDPQFTCGHLSPQGFAFYEVAGGHFSMLSEPHVEEVGRIFAAELDLSDPQAVCSGLSETASSGRSTGR